MKKFYILAAAAVMFGGITSSASAQIFQSDFGGADGTVVNGHVANTGQTWGAFSLWGSYGGMETDDAAGPSGNGSGNQGAGSYGATFRGNSVGIGQALTSGKVFFDFDMTTTLSGGGGAFAVTWLSDSVSGKSIAITRQNDRMGVDDLVISAPGFPETGFSTGVAEGGSTTTLHVQLEVNLTASTLDVHWHDYDNPATKGTINVGTIEGPYQPDMIHIWGRAATSIRHGWDNIAVTPEPASLILFSAGAMLLGLRRRR